MKRRFEDSVWYLMFLGFSFTGGVFWREVFRFMGIHRHRVYAFFDWLDNWQGVEAITVGIAIACIISLLWLVWNSRGRS